MSDAVQPSFAGTVFCGAEGDFSGDMRGKRTIKTSRPKSIYSMNEKREKTKKKKKTGKKKQKKKKKKKRKKEKEGF